MSIESVMPSNQSHPLSSPSPPALNLSQHQGLFKVRSSHQVATILEFQLHHQSFQWTPRMLSFRMDWLDLLAVQGTLKSLLQYHRLFLPHFGMVKWRLNQVNPQYWTGFFTPLLEARVGFPGWARQPSDVEGNYPQVILGGSQMLSFHCGATQALGLLTSASPKARQEAATVGWIPGIDNKMNTWLDYWLELLP